MWCHPAILFTTLCAWPGVSVRCHPAILSTTLCAWFGSSQFNRSPSIILLCLPPITEQVGALSAICLVSQEHPGVYEALKECSQADPSGTSCSTEKKGKLRCVMSA